MLTVRTSTNVLVLVAKVVVVVVVVAIDQFTIEGCTLYPLPSHDEILSMKSSTRNESDSS